MLGFMRKYQKYIYLIVTFVIVISFSFFGTYGALRGNAIHEQVAFTTINGQPVTRSELEEMVQFIGTDAADKKLFGGIWGPNFLNDGVIGKDFLEPGLAKILIEAYAPDLREDFHHRSSREKRFTPYVHPEAPFLSSRNAWTYFAPSIASNLDKLQSAADPILPDAMDARIQLYLTEKRLPGPYLQQILQYQEKQNSWIQHDPALEQTDFSLFGYHTITDWFGPGFERLVAQFIINAAAIAEAKGYVVSKEEAFASLVANAQKSFAENKNSPYLAATNAIDYLEKQLQRMRLDKSKAIKIWQKVLLFRRLFDDVGQSIWVSSKGYNSYNLEANAVAKGELLRLPRALQFNDFRSFQNFEAYISAVSKQSKEEREKLLLPSHLLKAEEVYKKHPELVQKRYVLEVASTSQKNLEAKVTVKDTLSWQLGENNWNLLKKEFPELGLKKGDSRQARLAALDTLDSITRSRVDALCRKKMVSEHPEWLREALKSAPEKLESVSIAFKGASPYFSGLDQGEAFIKRLDAAALEAVDPQLSAITFDQDKYYKIRVMERSEALEVMTFQEANAQSVLDELNHQTLEIYYAQIRSKDPATYQDSHKNFKPFSEVKEVVALSYYKPQWEAIKSALLKRKDKDHYKNLDPLRLAAYTFLPAAIASIEQMKQEPEALTRLTTTASSPLPSYTDQFKWQLSNLHISSHSDEISQAKTLFNTHPHEWSEIILAPNGDLLFAYVKEKAPGNQDLEMKEEQVARARFLLGTDAQRIYLESLLPLIKEKKAISFDYLHYGQNVIIPDA
jgi:GcvH upstream region-like protein